MKRFLAVDIGASSGRHIVGWRDGEEIRTDEVFRFENGVREREGHLVWDTDGLLRSVLDGIKAAFDRYGDEITSVAVDTWGVDYVLMRGDTPVVPCYAYRDGRTDCSIPQVHAKIPFEELYARTGIQFQPFNTIYQLYYDKIGARLNGVTDYLMIPEYLTYKLTGLKRHEYTNATTTGLVNGETGAFDGEIISRLGLPEGLFGELVPPGTVVGGFTPEVRELVGGDATVVLCASHDTASAVEGIPMRGEQAYISSGTWSLLGVKVSRVTADAASRLANYSNEGGVGYIRYQKNIMGMWVVNRLKAELCPDMSFEEIIAGARKSGFEETVDVNAEVFLAPKSMHGAFYGRLVRKPQTVFEYFDCAFRSLAESYRVAIAEAERNTCRRFDEIYIVGGGAKNAYLNELTERATGKRVIALPIEATAVGNLAVQMRALEKAYKESC